MKACIIGCGYVADFYMQNASSHKEIEIVGCYDINPSRQRDFSAYYGLSAFDSLQELLDDKSIEMVINLTNPKNHFDVSMAAIAGRKHVYTEKPIALTLEQADTLINLSHKMSVKIGCAPCNALSSAVNNLKEYIDCGIIGEVKIVYANFDDGMIAPNEEPWNWRSRSGAPWPARDEFEVGCTFEHAGYYLGVLAFLFGSARKVFGYSSIRISDKGVEVGTMAPDFSVGIIEYECGVVVRATTGLVAPEDKSLTVVGTKGCLLLSNLRNDNEPVRILQPQRKGEKILGLLKRNSLVPANIHYYKKLRSNKKDVFVRAEKTKNVDFLRGPSELVRSIEGSEPMFLNGEYGRHILEIIDILQYPDKYNGKKDLVTRLGCQIGRTIVA